MLRKLILAATTLAAALVLAGPAQADIVSASGSAGGHNHRLRWSLDYDTVTKDVTLTATHAKFDGSPAIGDPQKAILVVIRPNGTAQPFNLNSTAYTITSDDAAAIELPSLAGTTVQPLVAVSDGLPGIINKGPQTYNIPGGLKVSATRASLIEFRVIYGPPLGA